MIKMVGVISSILCLTSIATAQSPAVIIYPAGAYTIITPGPTTITYTVSSVTFSWPVTPAPVPVPPSPTPVPVPVLAGHVWALAIYDPTVVLPSAQQAALSSPTLKASALLQDVDIQSFACTDPAVANWIPHVPKTGFPVLMFIQMSPTGTGELVYSCPLPASESEILGVVHKVRGK